MPGKIDAKLEELGIELPEAAASVANYVPFVLTGNLLFISGQLPMAGRSLVVQGLIGEIPLKEGIKAARQCALNILAQAKLALDGDLDRVKRVVKLGGFVASTPTFFDHPQIMNGASDLMVSVFGDAGRHARFAVGVATLPRHASVEVDAIFEVG
jgi:enamine deaminase RidA (YjgF/YER057c/UK114 family)